MKSDINSVVDPNVFAFVAHKWDCEHLQPMWHQGPCDCGLYDLFDRLLSTGLSKNVRSTVSLITLYALSEICFDLISDWEKSRKKRIPMELYICRKCEYFIAEKQPDIQGWDGFCHHCGMIGQNEVGKLTFSKAVALDAKKSTT